MSFEPVVLSDSDTAPYPAATTSIGIRMTSADAGTFRLIPENPRRRAFFVSRIGAVSDFFVRPYVEPAGAGIVVSQYAPNLMIDFETFGLYVKGKWWVQSYAVIDLYFFECVDNPEG